MDEQLQNALLAIKSGKVEEAQLLLGELIQQDPQNVHAWFLLSTISKNEQQKSSFLQKVLTLNPTHKLALSQLAQLQNKQSQPVTITPEPVQPPPIQPPVETAAPIPTPIVTPEEDLWAMPDTYTDIDLTPEPVAATDPAPLPTARKAQTTPPPADDPLAIARALAKQQTVAPSIDKVALPPSPGSTPTAAPSKWLLPFLILLTIIVGILFYMVS